MERSGDVCECGMGVTARGRGAHRRGRDHAARMTERELVEAGWVRIAANARYVHLMEEVGFSIMRAATGVEPGSRYKSGKLIHQTWVRRWLVDLLMEAEVAIIERTRVQSSSPRVKQELRILMKIWRDQNRDPLAAPKAEQAEAS